MRCLARAPTHPGLKAASYFPDGCDQLDPVSDCVPMGVFLCGAPSIPQVIETHEQKGRVLNVRKIRFNPDNNR